MKNAYDKDVQIAIDKSCDILFTEYPNVNGKELLLIHRFKRLMKREISKVRR